MKRLIGVIGMLLWMVFNQSVWATTGDLFVITGSGTISTIDITLCLNGRSPNGLSCQNYTVTREILSIRTTTPGRTYPTVGIKIKTSGYSMSGCTLNSNGYCLFSANDVTSTTITATSATTITLTSSNPSSGTAAGGTGFTLTGTNLTGATGITFDGEAATSVNVVNSTSVTGVTPAHAVGAVDVVITTPNGTATLTNGYTYQTTAVGQSSGGGIIACLNEGNNLIAATADNNTGIVWGGYGTNVPNAESTTDGATNTTNIVNCLTNGEGGCVGGIALDTYAAGICSAYAVDSQGNSPCQTGNTCYDNWFLPAGNNDGESGQLQCLYTNKTAIGGLDGNFYWSSTEESENHAWFKNFFFGGQFYSDKVNLFRIRCVRGLTP